MCFQKLKARFDTKTLETSMYSIKILFGQKLDFFKIFYSISFSFLFDKNLPYIHPTLIDAYLAIFEQKRSL